MILSNGGVALDVAQAGEGSNSQLGVANPGGRGLASCMISRPREADPSKKEQHAGSVRFNLFMLRTIVPISLTVPSHSFFAPTDPGLSTLPFFRREGASQRLGVVALPNVSRQLPNKFFLFFTVGRVDRHRSVPIVKYGET